MTGKKMSSKRKKNLRALAQVMNKQNIVPIPITQPLLECFDVVITPQEADFLLKIGSDIQTYEGLVTLSDLDKGKFDPFLQNALEKGLIESFFDDHGKELFQLPAIAPGWFEHHMSAGRDDSETREFARHFNRYLQSFAKYNIFPLRILVNRFAMASKTARSIALFSPSSEVKQTKTIDVNREVDVPPTRIYPSWNVLEILDKYGDRNEICVVHCFCRQLQQFSGQPCRFKIPSESCINVGKLTKYFTKYGMGRLISKKEAIEIIKQAQRKGAVHQLFYEKEDMSLPEIAICNCCWDCCGMLRPYNQGILPVRLKSFYYSQISNISACDHCGTCEKYCPVNAITRIEKKTKIDSEICIGCGQCAIKCAKGVFSLHYKEHDVFLPVLKKSKARTTS